jgi:hypothetical protein
MPCTNKREPSEMCRLTFIVYIFMISINVMSAQNRHMEYKPVFAIGDNWDVEVNSMTEPPESPEVELAKWKPQKYTVIYHFTIESMEIDEVEQYYNIRIDGKSLNGEIITAPVEYYRIYLRQNDMSLIKLERWAAKSGKLRASKQFEHGAVDATGWVGALPLAFPIFQAGVLSVEPNTHRSEGKAGYIASGQCRQSGENILYHYNGEERDAINITLDRAEVGQSRRINMTWLKGMPWWVEGTYYRDGRAWSWARLLVK